jgi:UDP-N-acetylglucosamine 2-epimerase (non-hydrolysing)
MKNGDYKLLFEKETFTNNHFKKSVDGKQPFRKRKTKNVNRIAIILGTHPEIIKMSPVIRACEDQNRDYFVLHTGQHYLYTMDRVFFEQLELPEAEYNLDVGSGTHAQRILGDSK